MLESIIEMCVCVAALTRVPADGVACRHHLDKSKMIMVGDRLNTDIAFGNHGGIATLMVLTGGCRCIASVGSR